MKADRRMKESCRGSTVLYAVFLSALLAVLGTAFLTAGAYSRRETAWQMRYGQAQAAARSLHKSFCQAVNEGTSAAMNQIWDRFREDCRSCLTDCGEEDPEEILQGEMEGREYVSAGRGGTDEMQAEILLKALPFDGIAYVYTQVEWEEFTICLGGEIHFDNEEGDTLLLPGSSEEEMRLCMTGRRVYRYWREQPGGWM